MGLMGESYSSGDDVGLSTPIAVCGMALRLPGGITTPEQFWEFLINKRDARSRVPPSRYDIATHCSPFGGDGLIPTEHGYFIDAHPGELDKSFFSFTKAELEYIDPHQRHLLEVVHECFESAGEANYRGANIGCYVGSFSDDWRETLFHDLQMYGKYPVAIGGDFSVPNRISFEYDLRGPSVSTRTACSSALVALTQACTAISVGECDAALVAGCQFILTPTMNVILATRGMLSKDGACKSFDAAADGYGRGEAINAVYLKPLAAAVRDRNPIRAVIRGTAVNDDGKTAGFSVPSTSAQEALIRQAYRIAGITDCTQTPFVECHGTGTKVGDPIEASTVARVYEGKQVYIGSVKPNMGHSEGASGLTSLIKAILAVENGVIPPNIRFETPNPKIPFSKGGLTVPTDPVPWPSNRPLRVGVNSFGMGGVNAHTIVESARNLTPPHSPRLISQGSSLLLFSANTFESLPKIVANNHAYLERHPQALADLAYTLAARRVHLPIRTYSVVAGGATRSFPSSRVPERRPEIVMVFTGQGAQWPGMGVQLYKTNRVFKESLDSAERVLAELPEAPKWSLVEEIHKVGESSLHQAQYAQPLCTALQIALVDALAELGVKPFAVVGHSSGELAAAYASGRLTAREAMICAFYRGLVSAEVDRPGAMAAIGMGREETEPFLGPEVVVACENSPSSVTISGNMESVEEAMHAIKTRSGVLVRQLKIDTAYHSSHMKDVGGRYKSLLDRYLGSDVDSSIPFASSVTGNLEHVTIDAGYWQSNLECPVRFNQAVGAILDSFKQPLFFLEVGPHSALSGPLRQIFDHKSAAHGYGSCLVRHKPCSESFLCVIGQLFAQNQPMRLDVLTDPDGTAQVVADAPTYSWDHSMSQVYAPRSIKEWKKSPFPRHELLGARNVFSTDDQPSWRNVLFFKHVPWMHEHKVAGNAVFPAAGYIAMAVEAARQVCAGDAGYKIQNLQLSHAMVLDRYNTIEIMISLRRCGGWYEFNISSHNGVSWVEHCSGRVRRGASFLSQARSAPKKLVEENDSSDLTRSINPAKWYQSLAKNGVDYGTSFQGIRSLWSSASRLYSSATVTSTVKKTIYYPVHPTKLDSCFQAVYAAAYQGFEWKMGQLPVPTRFGEINLLDCGSDITVNVSAHSLRGGALSASAEAYAADGTIMMTLEDTLIQPLGTTTPEVNRGSGARLHWGQAIDFVPLSSLVSSPPDATENASILDRLTKACIEESLSRLEKEGVSGGVSHLAKYHNWLQEHRGADISGLVLKDLARQASTTSIGACAAAMVRVVDNIVPLCRGEVDPVELLMSDDTLVEMYNYLNMVDRTPLFKALGHHHPSQRILEIGAGTGGTTAKIIGETRYSTYTFTDISAAFFPAARSRFGAYPNMVYKTLDVTQDPLSQGFAPESFDLIIASNVLHATPSLHETLVNVRRLLHPRGKLLLEELCGDIKYSNIVTGVLSGWWAGEADGRPNEPYVSPERWDVEMRAAGFDGLDGLAFDAATPLHSMAYMLSSPNTDTADAPNSRIQNGHVGQPNGVIQPKVRSMGPRKSAILVSDSGCSDTVIIFQKQLRSRGYNVTVQGLGESLARSSDVIVLVDTAAPFFHDISASKLAKFQEFLRELQRSHSGALWVTRSSQLGCKDPRHSLAIGVARTSRTEFGVDFATCELDTVDYAAVALTLDVFEQFGRRIETETYLREMEYIVHKNSVFVGRMLPFSMQEEVENPGRLEFDRNHSRLAFDSDAGKWIAHVLQPTLGPNEVEIDVDTAGVSYLDVLTASDVSVTSGAGLGLDAAGTVRRVGSQVTNLAPGNRVVALTTECFGTSVKVAREYCAQIPDELSLKDASTMPLAFATAMHALADVGRLKKAQTILIHSASGGVGSAAVQLGQLLGAEIYATVGSDEKAEKLAKTYGIPRERIFSSIDASFVRGIKEATANRGVDLLLNTLSGDLFAASCECVAPHGKLINLVKTAASDTQIPSKVLMNNVALVTIDMLDQLKQAESEEPVEATQRPPFLARIIDLYSQGQIRPLNIAKTFPARDVQQCLKFVESREHIGKVLLSMARLEELPPPSRPLSTSFDRDASYLLVGGLGGLGQGLARWMAEHGATHFVFLSRSAGAETHQELFRELESKGCTVTLVRGDVSNVTDVQKAITAGPAPLKGILNLSMVLQDGSLLAMSSADWKAATQPKVQGTWNLHAASRDVDLDFFVLFSSMCGIIGMPGQANYSAGNTFMDAFVQYRHNKGLPASVIDVGAVEGIGWTADNTRTLERSKWLEGAIMSQRELFEAVTLAIFGSNYAKDGSPTAVEPSQIITGFRMTPSLTEAFRGKATFLDRRLATYANGDSGADVDDAGPGTVAAALHAFIATLPANVDKLDDPVMSKFIAREIAAWVFDLLLKPVEDDAEVDLARSFVDIGFDSLAAVELRSWWRATLGFNISVLEIMSFPNLGAIGEHAVKGLKAKFVGGASEEEQAASEEEQAASEESIAKTFQGR